MNAREKSDNESSSSAAAAAEESERARNVQIPSVSRTKFYLRAANADDVFASPYCGPDTMSRIGLDMNARGRSKVVSSPNTMLESYTNGKR